MIPTRTTPPQSKDPNLLGYCFYCKDPIYIGDDYVPNKSGRRLYHSECFEQKTNTKRELKFE